GAAIIPGIGASPIRVPLSVICLDAFLTSAAAASPRLLVRLAWRRSRRRRSGDEKHALIAGAGAAGQMIVKELLMNPQLGMYPMGFVDDDERKHRHRLGDLPVLGSLSDIPELVRRRGIHMVIIAMP